MGLVTVYASKYRRDPFFRTEFNVIALQILFGLFILFVVVQGVALRYQRLPMMAIIVISTAIFVYLITRLALAPARNALEAQKQFIGNIAHELRTPLSVIKTNTEVALLDDTAPIGMRETLHDTIEELDRISDIINNLLSLNVLVRQEKMTFTNVDLGVVVRRMTKHLHILITKKKINLSISESEYQNVWGNTTALEQIVMNVLKNAVNYTLPEGSITLSIKPDYQGHILLTVEDTGIGIEKKDLNRIFEPFFRSDQSRARISGGSGLGLAIVNELIKLHRGSMLIQSAKDYGTLVEITLPCGHEPDRVPIERRKEDQPVHRERRKRVSEVEINYSQLPFTKKDHGRRS
ncbi:MAG: cell wall metabolism sensor histidine kinase WalK [Parcubacteria group bacterium]|nr:cell wall metabolism sensor histidine kinase WalK [Parcubacteria group bacterium]